MFLTNTTRRIVEIALNQGMEPLTNAERMVFNQLDKEYRLNHGYSISDGRFMAEMDEYIDRIQRVKTKEQYDKLHSEYIVWINSLTAEQENIFAESGYGEMLGMLGQCFR